MMRTTHTRSSALIAALTTTLALLVSLPATAQTQNAENAQQVGRIDWSGSQGDTEVNSLSQPTRFSQRSSIPQTRTGNEAFFQPEPTRERGGTVPDRLETYTNRSGPIVR